MMVKAIDLFAGWGGFTLGATKAGVDVVYAANHWPLAVRAHKLNHPDTFHECQDLRQADWSAVPDYDILLAAPACQGSSQASQSARKKSKRVRAYHNSLRATAMAVIGCADVTEPKAIIVENVLEFKNWRLYPGWRKMLKDLGYVVKEHTLLATDFGVPQRRKRLFITATRKPFHFEIPKCKKEPPFAPCIQWRSGRWRPISEAGAGAQERIRVAKRNHGNRVLSQHVTGHPGVPLHEAIRTITTKDHWILVNGSVYRPLTRRENARGMGFPDLYDWPEDASRGDIIKGVANAVCPPIAQALVEQIQAVI